MNYPRRGSQIKVAGAAWLLAAGGFAAFAAELPRSPNRLWLGADFTANVTATFKQLGGSPARSDPGSPTGGVDHFYDDGYHRVDASGNVDGTSWFWGYEQAQQLPGNDSLLLNSHSSPAQAAIEADTDAPSFGVELGYSRELGQIARARWGLEVVFGFSNFDFEQRGALVADALRVTDAYDLGGVMVPQAPYHGTFEGPARPADWRHPNPDDFDHSRGIGHRRLLAFRGRALRVAIGALYPDPADAAPGHDRKRGVRGSGG